MTLKILTETAQGIELNPPCINEGCVCFSFPYKMTPCAHTNSSLAVTIGEGVRHIVLEM